MKLNATPRHYMPLPQNQSDDDESGPSKEEKDKLSFQPTDVSDVLIKDVRQSNKEEADPKSLPMSGLRMFMFVVSLILCIAFVAVFILILPCTRPEKLNNVFVTQKWTRILQNMSFSSILDVSRGDTKTHAILIGYNQSEEHGVIALQESDGRVLWKLPLHAIPYASKCNAIDVNSDGLPECLIFGDNGLLTAVDVKKGVTLWYLHNHSGFREADSISLPSILTDCNNDNVSDLILSYNIENFYYFALVSGSTGQIVGPLLDIPHCAGPILAHFTWNWKNETDLAFYCEGMSGGNLWLLSSQSICDVAFNGSDELKTSLLYKFPEEIQEIQFYKVSSSESQVVAVVDGIKLMFLERSKHRIRTFWQSYMETPQHLRVVADGRFCGGNSQLVALSSNLSHTRVIALNLIDGKEECSLMQVNGTITSVLKVPQFFGNKDGLIMKTLVPVSSYRHELIDLKSGKHNFSEYKDGQMDKFVPDYDLMQMEETYILVKNGEKEIKIINKEEIWSHCNDNSCRPDVYTRNNTALLLKDGVSTNMIILRTTNPSLNTSGAFEETIVKNLKIGNTMQLSKCDM